jgi:hypothetical protein
MGTRTSHNVIKKCVLSSSFLFRVDDVQFSRVRYLPDAGNGGTQPATPALVLTCTPATVIRGETVSCTARTEPATAPGELKITGWSFEGRARKDGDPTSTEWTGVIVADGRIEVRGTIGSATEQRDDQRLRVKPRVWPNYSLTQMPDTLIVLLPGSSAYPQVGTKLGTFSLRLLDHESISSASDSISTGPNAGFLFLRAQPNLDGVGADITLHPGLYPPPPGATWAHPGYEQWYKDQNKKGSGTCDASVIEKLRRGVERHEGVTLSTDSHLGVANRAFRELRPQTDMEEWVVVDQPRSVAADKIQGLWQEFRDIRVRPKQVVFDQEDYPRIYSPAALGCVLDLNPGDN